MDDNSMAKYQHILEHLWIHVQREIHKKLKHLLAVEAGFDHLDPKEIDKLIERLLA